MARPRSDIAPRLVHAARQRFLEDGVDGASLRQISKEAGTNLGMLYYYFKTKDELFLAVVEEVYAGLVRDLHHALDPAKPFEDRVRDLYARLGRLSDDEFVVLRLVAREAMVSSERLGRVLARFREGHIADVLRTLADGWQSGQIRQDLEPAALLPCLAGLAFGLVLARRVGDAARAGDAEPPWPPAPPSEVARTAADLVLRGLKKD
jgi:AcrR family transcriptional regulator